MPEHIRTIYLSLYYAARLALACAPNDDMYRVINSLLAQLEIVLDLPRQPRTPRTHRHHSAVVDVR